MVLNKLTKRNQGISNDSKQFSFWLLLVLIAAHAFIKFNAVSTLEVQGDEAFSIFYAQQSVNELLHTLNNEANPPLYYLILHFWIKLFGIGLFAVKSLNIFISIGTAILLYKLTKKVGNYWFVIFVSGCFLFSNLHFDFSHEIRAFQLVLFLTVASYYTLFSFISTQNKKWLLALVLINVALPLTHYNAVLVPLVQFLGCFTYWKTQRKMVYLLFFGYVASALLFLPQLFIFKGVVPDENFWLGLSTWNDFKFVLQKVMGNDLLFYELILTYFIAPLFLIVGLRYKWFMEKFSWRIFIYFWMLFLIPLLINFVLAQYTPSFQVRYVLFTSFGLYLSIGYLFLHLEKGKWLFRAYFLFLLLHFQNQFNPSKRDGEGWKETAQTIKTFQKRKVAVLVSSTYKARDLLYYYDQKAFSEYKTIDKSFEINGIFPVLNVDDVKAIRDLGKYEKIILVLSHNEIQDPKRLIPAYLDKTFSLCYEIGDPVRAKIRLYNTQNTPCASFKVLTSTKEKSDYCWYWDVSLLEEEIMKVKVIKNKLNTKDCGPYVVTKEVAYSPNRVVFVKDIVLVDCEVEFESEEIPNSSLVISIEKEGETFKRAEYKLKESYLNGEKKILIKSSVVGTYPEGSQVKVYIWNPGGPDLEIKNLTIQYWKK